MDDSSIVALYFARSEQAIQETDAKYGGYCYSIAYNILANQEDSEESVNDTYLSAWNSIPPRKPNPLAPFLGKIVSIGMWRKNGAFKRGGDEMPLVLEELQECVASGDNLEERYEQKVLVRQVRKFLPVCQIRNAGYLCADKTKCVTTKSHAFCIFNCLTDTDLRVALCFWRY